MALSSWNTGRFANRDLAGSMRGLDCFLCCPGPSLKDVRDEDLHVPGAMVLAVNTAYPHVRPDVWIGMDRPECYDPRLLAEPFVKLVGSRYRDDAFAGRMIREYPNVCFVSGTEGRPHELFDRLGPDAEFIWNGNTFQTALHLAVWLGCERINLLGCDFGGASDYHDARVLAEPHKRRNRELYARLVDELPMIRLEAQARGVQIVSCTPDSPANEHLRYVPLAEAVQRAGENVPVLPAGRLLDAADAELCRWGPERDHRPGVVTGCDAAQEWMLPWWWGCYRAHNGFPVAFADFGMSAQARAWCAERGSVIDVQGRRSAGLHTTQMVAWFRKPLAVLKSPFARTIWLDTDCEVRGDLTPLFDAEMASGLAAARDGHNPKDRRADALNTGVLVVDHGAPIVASWARFLLADPSAQPGDQEFLNAMDGPERDGIAIIPKRFNWLRLDGPADEEAIVLHWTGRRGKAHIAARIKAAGKAMRPPAGETGRAHAILEQVLRRFGAGPVRGAEIGVLAGRTSATLLRHLPRLELTMIDRWAPADVDSDYAASGDANATKDPDQYLRDMRRAIASTDFARGRRRILRGESVAMAALVPDGELDFVFLDGDHSLAGMTADLAAWTPKLRDGGILCGHDLDNPDYPGFRVREAVEAFLKETMGAPLQVERGADFTWFVERPRRRESQRLTA